jgi:hypothetical protein
MALSQRQVMLHFNIQDIQRLGEEARLLTLCAVVVSLQLHARNRSSVTGPSS